MTLPLGTSQQVQLQINNSDTQPRQPLVYEAWSPPPPGVAAVQEALPESLRQVALPEQPERVDPELSLALAAAPAERTEVLLFLADQPDLSAAYAITDWNARGRFVYQTLARHAEQSQGALRTWLAGQGIAYRPLWVVNGVLVQANQAEVQALAQRAEVALLRANRTAQLGARLPPPGSSQAQFPTVNGCELDGTCWHVRQVGGYRTWADFGVSGQGITVANIDSGVDFSHPALVQHYRGNRGGGTFEHAYNWFDPGRFAIPNDLSGASHGTHVMGTMVGRGNGTGSQPAVGIAPGARWIAARGCRGDSCSESDLIEAAQWMLAPTNNDNRNPRPDLRPHIINNSWADSTGGQTWYAGYVAAWRAAGIIPLFAAGNSKGGPAACGSISSPGDFANVIAVGATDNADQIASFSQRGPSADGRLKPDISAPGTAVPSTVAGGGLAYSTLNGTSMATPITSGVVALMLAANPSLIGDYDRVYSLLTGSARPRPSSICGGTNSATGVPNNVYGNGRVDAYTAVAAARVDVPWLATTAPMPIDGASSGSLTVTLDARRIIGPGVYEARLLIFADALTLTPLVVPVRMQVTTGADIATVQGSVRALNTGQPLLATVTIDEGVSLQSATDGSFSLVLPQRSQPYTITASTQGYLSQTQVVTVSTALLEVNFALGADAPRLSTSPEPPTITLRFSQAFTMPMRLENSGTRPLNFSLSVPNERYGVWRSDVSGGPESGWIDPPASARVLTLGDDQASEALPLGFDFPFNGISRRQVYVSANGFLSFGPLPRAQSFRSSCLPLPETNEAAIVPLRMDLDPNVGGRITAAQLENGFLVTFDNVPRHSDATSRYSFQVLLANDGRVVLNYRQLGNLPPSAAMGLQFFGPDNQLIGCDGDIPLAPNLTLELRPQPNTRLWMSVPQPGGTIEPGEATSVAVVFRWLHPNYPSPYSGTLLVTSNDPSQPSTQLPMRLTLFAAPYTYLFPIVLKDARPAAAPE